MSCQKEDSDSVDQDKIYVRYVLEYNSNEDKTSLEDDENHSNINDDDGHTTTVVGYLDWIQSSNKLDFLYVHPNYARRQVATKLLQQLLLNIANT